MHFHIFLLEFFLLFHLFYAIHINVLRILGIILNKYSRQVLMHKL